MGDMGNLLVDFLTGITLSELVERQKEKDRTCLPAAAANGA